MILKNIIKNFPKTRKIPYPYKAGLAISNDVEFMNFEFFDTFMSFLNSKKQTPLGEGLGLEITSSLFFYSDKPYDFSYFESLDIHSKKSKNYERIIEYLKTGWIDTNHAYGNFDGVGGFTRAHAERVIEEISKYNIKIPCFTNHGDIFNIQNVGKDAKYHRGDLINDKAYHADLFGFLGTKYFWTDSAIIEKGESKFRKIFKNKLRRVIKKDSLQDGREVMIFNRFRSTGPNAPNLSSLGYQIEQLGLENIYSNKEFIIIYQHLGVLYRYSGKCIPTTIEGIKSRPEVFLSPFYFLAREFHEGRLWITSLYNLLKYAEMVISIKIDEKKENFFEIITDNEVKPLDYFQGLTIYINPNKPVYLKYKNFEIPINYNGPDESGHYSVTVPLKKKEMIW